MELALIRSLMNKEFYDSHRGSRCPERLFSPDVRKIKKAIDSAMHRYERTVTPDEIEALFMSNNAQLTTAQKNAYSSLFNQVKKESPMGGDVAQEVLSKLFQQVVGEDIANIINKNEYPPNKEDLKVEDESSDSALGSIGLKPKIVH